MQQDPLVYQIFLIFTGAAVFATLALAARQAMIVAYILLGIVFGPHALGLVNDAHVIEQISHIGIMFLLFLLGLNLHPQKLLRLLKTTSLITAVSSLVLAGSGFLMALAFGYVPIDSALIGLSLMFSSTIIGIKLLPTTVLHHQRIGAIMISVLLLQDIIAVVLLIFLQLSWGEMPIRELGTLALSLPLLIVLSYLLERYVLIKLIQRFDTIQEYIFLMAIGWCLGIAVLGAYFGLSEEIGAFIAGISLAASPIATFIAESLKPLRDFFLILFFFALGVGFDISALAQVILAAGVITLSMLVLKPLVFQLALKHTGEAPATAWEIGIRLGQISEFSLLIAMLAQERGVISAQASFLIQTSTLISFILSSYIIVMRYPTPIAVSERLRRD